MFIDIEWVDGSWKRTQTKLLTEYLQKNNSKISTIDFPRYWSWSSVFVEKFLNWEFWNMEEVDNEIASIFYTMDRFWHKKELQEMYKNSDYLITDRYSISSYIHRWTEFLKNNDKQWMYKFFDWLSKLEFEQAKLPKPDLIIFLSLSLENIKYLMKKKQAENRDFASLKNQDWLDIAESDIHHQELSLQVWKEILPEYFKDKINYVVLECDAPNWWVLSIQDIHNNIKSILLQFK